MAEPPRRSPLEGVLPAGRHGAAAGDAGVRIAEATPSAMAQIHGAHDASLLAPARAVLGLDGGAAPQPDAADARACLLRNGPGKFLAVSDAHADAALAAALAEAFGDAGAVAVDASHARTVLRVLGPAARELLAKGCPLDVDALAPGHATPTVVSHFSVLVHCTGPDGFDLYVTRSFAAAFAEWLLEAGAEFGVECG